MSIFSPNKNLVKILDLCSFVTPVLSVSFLNPSHKPYITFYVIVVEDGNNVLVPEAKVKQMKELADIVVEERSNHLKEQLKVVA